MILFDYNYERKYLKVEAKQLTKKYLYFLEHPAEYPIMCFDQFDIDLLKQIKESKTTGRYVRIITPKGWAIARLNNWILRDVHETYEKTEKSDFYVLIESDFNLMFEKAEKTDFDVSGWED